MAGGVWRGVCKAGGYMVGGIHGWGACVAGGMHGGGVCMAGGVCVARGLCMTCTPPGQILRLRNTVNERAVRILLECILVVFLVFLSI